MKNIHLITTNKPSRLHEFGDIWFNHKESNECFRNYNIYITSDEEIKEGDWFINSHGQISKCVRALEEWLKLHKSNIKKIILTTDQDLIADGIQAIDDEFLEWFVKNSSCEFIETKLINFEIDMRLGDSCIEYGSYYEIIFPKEEPKSLNLKELELKLDNILENETKESLTDWLNSKKLQKQECEYLKRSSMDKEIEEAAEKYANKKGDILP